MIIGLHHVQFTVSPGEGESAREFYCGFLGFREIPKPESLREKGGFWMELGGTGIHVGVEENIDRRKSKAHLAFLVQELENWRARLAARHIVVIDGVPIPGYNRFEFRDPFGNRVEFLEAIQ